MKQWGIVAGLLTLSLPSYAVEPVSKATTFEIQGDSFVVGGQPLVLRSGEIHYPRIPRAYWRDRLRKMKALGLNTISTYIFWNVHEPKEGVFDFSGEKDVATFVRIAQEEGLYVILRPGPYVCAEWEFGGLPAWLLKDPSVKVRSSDPRFVAAATRYLKRVGEELSGLVVAKGGPVLLVQVENEYGSYGKDVAYMQAIRQSLTDAGFGPYLYTTDSVWGRWNVQDELKYGTFPDLPMAINFGQTADPGPSMEELTRFRPRGPRMVGEYWTGWFETWGGPRETRSPEDGAKGLDWLLQRKVSFNLYMAHGGTNFGFMNGANWDKGKYKPDTTSYDYDALLDEAGRPTPKYDAYREVIARHLPPGEVLPPVPSSPKPAAYGELRFDEGASFEPLLREKVVGPRPKTMEELDQAYGFVFYRHTVKQPYWGMMDVDGVRDYAVVLHKGQTLGTLDRRRDDRSLFVQLEAGVPLEVLVENTGRLNFSDQIVGERKGILGPIKGWGFEFQEWESQALPMDDLSALRFERENSQGQRRGPRFYRAKFVTKAPKDTFLDTKGWAKGIVFVNGRALGRYWKDGPQRSLFVPGPWLRSGVNEVVVFELHDPGPRTMRSIENPER